MKFLTILLSLFQYPLMQTPTGTNQFFEWYFYGFKGLGGWLLFLLLAVAATIWLFYDSQKRHLPATGWKFGVVILTLFLLPTILYRFTVTNLHYQLYELLQLFEEDCQIGPFLQSFPELNFTDCDQLRRSLPPMTPFGEYVFYLGLLGGVLAPVLAVGYYITFQGMVGCIRGHEPYEKALEKIPGQCPMCAAEEAAKKPIPVSTIKPPTTYDPAREKGRSTPPPKRRPTINYAWLVDVSNDNRRYDLYEGTTRIGRDNESDVVLKDPSVSRPHAQIRESHGHFTLTDMGSSSGTLLNGKKLRTPLVLQNGDEITLGDTVLRFITINN